jgi:hypothetical protein
VHADYFADNRDVADFLHRFGQQVRTSVEQGVVTEDVSIDTDLVAP